jgi:hypothetical protein
MAKDGTMRGGPRVGQTGRPKKALIEKVENNNPGGRKLEVLNIPEFLVGAELEGNEIPPVKEYLSAQQRDGRNLEAADIYKNTWLWLKNLNCEKFVNSQLIEQYAMSVARWLQCEEAITKFGFLGKHPTSGAPIQSPYVAMSQSFMKQANLAWLQIFQIVKENCTTDFRGPNPQDDAMERLLRSRRK